MKNAKTASPEHPVVELACELISRPSVTPHDAGCQDLLASRLGALGFHAERIDREGVSNLWLRRGTQGPLVVFAGHTDVVPPGPAELWDSEPFTPTVRDGFLVGRGASDMKGSIAAFVVAAEAFVEAFPDHRGSVALLITSDEEGEAVHGTRSLVEELQRRNAQIDYCMVGEPTSRQRLGDEIKIGRRGSLTGRLLVRGTQGHTAYPEKAHNPIHAALKTLERLVEMRWEPGNPNFPAATLQLSNISAGTGAANVIPAELRAVFNVRFPPPATAKDIKRQIEDILDGAGIDFEIQWEPPAEPYLSRAGRLATAAADAIRCVSGIDAALTTGGGTSDGRFIATTGAEVVEIGPSNATIHSVNERVTVDELKRLTEIYRLVLEELLGGAER